MSMHDVASWAASGCNWGAVVAGLWSAYLWAAASQARVDFQIGEHQAVGGGNLSVEVTKAGVINPDATARLSNQMNGKAAVLTATAIGLQTFGTLLAKLH